MDEDEAELLSLTRSLSPSNITTEQTPQQIPLVPPVPPPVAPPIAPIPPPIAPIPSLPHHAAVAAAVAASNDRESSLAPPSADDYLESDSIRLARERQEKLVQELLLKRRAYALAVPTNDAAVRARLRRLHEPITLFGEREMERRDRLRALMARLEAEGQLDALLKAHDEDQADDSWAEAEEEEAQISYPFYTEGTKELLEARKDIARFSLRRAGTRIARARKKRKDPDEDEEAEAKEACRVAGEFVLECSEIGDDRPLSGCSFSRDGTMLATW